MSCWLPDYRSVAAFQKPPTGYPAKGWVPPLEGLVLPASKGPYPLAGCVVPYPYGRKPTQAGYPTQPFGGAGPLPGTLPSLVSVRTEGSSRPGKGQDRRTPTPLEEQPASGCFQRACPYDSGYPAGWLRSRPIEAARAAFLPKGCAAAQLRSPLPFGGWSVNYARKEP